MLKALLDHGMDVLVLSRKADAVVPAGVTLKQVNYGDCAELTTALQGIDAVIDCTGAQDVATITNLIDAADAAGVQRFVAGLWGGDPAITEMAQLPVFATKGAVLKHIKEKTASSSMTWTAVACGGFLDSNLGTGFLGLSLHRRRVRLFDDGKNPTPLTTMASTAQATTTLLTDAQALSGTANRVVRVSNCIKSQVDLYHLAKEALGDDAWTEEESQDMKAVLKNAMDELAKGNLSVPVFIDILHYTTVLPQYSKCWAENDNALLGVQAYSDDHVKKLITEVSKQSGYPDLF